jgi:RNA polymerase sigma-70 factor (ECF subfamily)
MLPVIFTGSSMILLVLPEVSMEDHLLALARDGDQNAIMEIYERYFTPIYQFIRLRTDDGALAEDIASDVFVKLVSALRGRNAPRHSLRGWLFQVARNELYHQYGKQKRYPTVTLDEWIPASSENQPEAQFIRSLRVESAWAALRTLTADQQEVLILRFGQALSLEETSDVMGKSVSAIKSLQLRAVNALRQVLSDMRDTVNE